MYAKCADSGVAFVKELGNVKVVKHDVAVLLRDHMKGEAFTEAYILFPVKIPLLCFARPASTPHIQLCG